MSIKFRKFLKSLDCTRETKYKDRLKERIFIWNKRLYEYEIKVNTEYDLPDGLKRYGASIRSIATFRDYDTIEGLKRALAITIAQYENYTHAIERSLRFRKEIYLPFEQSNKEFDFKLKPFVKVLASGSHEKLLYVFFVEKNDKTIFVTGYDSNAKEMMTDQKYYYDWSRFEMITDDVDFRKLLNSYGKYLSMSGKTVDEIKNIRNEMIKIFENLTNTQFVE